MGLFGPSIFCDGLGTIVVDVFENFRVDILVFGCDFLTLI